MMGSNRMYKESWECGEKIESSLARPFAFPAMTFLAWHFSCCYCLVSTYVSLVGLLSS